MAAPWLRRPVVAGLALSLLAMGTSTFTTLGLGALAPYLRASFGLSTFEVGALPALVFLGALSVSVAAGKLTDRVGAGRALAVALVGVAVGIGFAAVAPSTIAFLCGVALGGVGYGAVNPATNVLSTSLVPRDRRAFFLSIKQAGVTLGGLLAGAILPTLADLLGWRQALIVPIACLLGCAAGAVWAARRERAGWFDAPGSVEGKVSLVRVTVPGGTATALFGFVSSGVQLSVAGYLTVYLVDTQNFSKPVAGVGLSVAFAAGCVGRLAWGAISDRVFSSSHATTLVISSIGSIIGLIALASGVSGILLWPVHRARRVLFDWMERRVHGADHRPRRGHQPRARDRARPGVPVLRGGGRPAGARRAPRRGELLGGGVVGGHARGGARRGVAGSGPAKVISIPQPRAAVAGAGRRARRSG